MARIAGPSKERRHARIDNFHPAMPPRSLPLPPHRAYSLGLLLVYIVIWLLLALDPRHPRIWWLENILVGGFLGYLLISFRSMPLSRLSYTLIFLFLALHTVGAHYSYGEVPYNDWWRALTGRTLNEFMNWERHNFDRVVHLCYGLFLAYPIRELFLRVAAVRGFWGYFLPLDLTLATSAMFELFEWAGATWAGGELGRQYLATQGDRWDPQKDMLLAGIGALVAMLLTLAVNAYRQRDFVRDWQESVSVKESRPLGEESLVRSSDKSGGK